MTTPIRFYTDMVTTKERGGVPEGSPEAKKIIAAVIERNRKKSKKPQGISLVDARPPKKEGTT